MRRLIVALTDGLRPDAITSAVMPSLRALGDAYTIAPHARTVTPSTTVPFLASLATGVAPNTHRLVEPGLEFLSRAHRLRPVARELARHGVPTDVVTAELPFAARSVACALASAAGVRKLIPAGQRARDTARAALGLLGEYGWGLLFVYFPDCDRAGHAHGWMSDQYLEAAAEVDAAIGRLSAGVADSLLIVVADHGGGGVEPTEHYHAHPMNAHVPLVIAGPGVARCHRLEGAVSLLDVCPTVLWWFGVPIPDGYEGRALTGAFAHARLAEAAAG